MKSKSTASIWVGLLCAVLVHSLIASDDAGPAQASDLEGWNWLFDGKTLDGWKASENPDSFTVQDGMIVAHAQGAPIPDQASFPKSHLFYVGADGNASFTDFELEVDVKTEPNANGGIYFHTDYVQNNWPQTGFEVQVINSPGGKRKTGSLYAVQDVSDPPVKDGEWFTVNLVVQGSRVVVKLQGQTVVDWTQPADFLPPTDKTWSDRRLSPGTFALQAHDPGSVVYYKNIRVRPLVSKSDHIQSE